MASFLREALNMWAMQGMFDVVLPLILMFAIIFSILQRTKILGESKQINATVSFIISLFVIMNPIVAPFMASIFANAGLALIVMVAILILVGLFMKEEEMPPVLKWLGAVGGIFLFFLFLKFMSGWFGFGNVYIWFSMYGITKEAILSLLLLIVGGAIIVLSGGKGKATASTARARD